MIPVSLSLPGILSALGRGPEQTLAGLLAGDTRGMVAEPAPLGGGMFTVGRVAGELPPIPPALARHDSRNNRLLMAAVEQLAPQIEELRRCHERSRIGIVLGTSTSGVAEGEAALRAWKNAGALPPGFHYEQMEIGDPAVFLARLLELQGPAYTISTACSSGAKALVSASKMLQAGICDAVLTGAVDSLCALTLCGFASLESVSPQLCRPLSRTRNGINIGEGAALFVMTRGEGPVMLLGAGESSDAHHLSAPHPQGLGAELAMREALAGAGLAPGAVDYLNLHATATPKNDVVEAHAVARVFPDGIAVSGTKALTGHALGAAGALEAAFCHLMLAAGDGRIAPHVWDGDADPELPALDIVTPGRRFARSAGRALMSNSFAFGGNNVCLILGDPR